MPVAPSCTGISAHWCPIHGDCTCADPQDKNDDNCPLHSWLSTHGDPVVFQTIWGTLILEDNPCDPSSP